MSIAPSTDSSTPQFSATSHGINPIGNGTTINASCNGEIQYSEMVARAKVAIVDDEEVNILYVQRQLKEEGYRHFYSTVESTHALSLIYKCQPDVVLLDVRMPKVSGLEILELMREDQSLKRIPVIVLTACVEPNTKLQALKYGPSDFLAKPLDSSELLLRMKNLLTVKAYQDFLTAYSVELERQTAELATSRQEIINCLARAAEFRDDDTGNHVARVGRYAAIIADQLGFSKQDVELLEQAAQLHDIGKIGVEDSVLLKDGKLDPEEFERIKQHCSAGRSIIQPVSNGRAKDYQRHTAFGATLLGVSKIPIMKLAATIAQTHHEKWDGSSYPIGLAGEDIPIEGRITAVADVFDALSSKRPYKPAFPREKCFQILEEGRGKHFDPRVLDAFFARSHDIVQTQIEYAEVD